VRTTLWRGAAAGERDVVAVRHQAREVAALLGLGVHDQTRLATAVSEIVRNGVAYASGCEVEVEVEKGSGEAALVVTVSDRGPGIADVGEVLEGSYRSPSGLGVGMRGARRLVDGFAVRSGPDGTTVEMRTRLRGAPVDGLALALVRARLAEQEPQGAYAEVRRQNQELALTLQGLLAREEDLARVNRELEDTNRGVLVLYSELEERAEQLKTASEAKSRFLASLSHELRTPINSILGLARILLDRCDGELTPEQERQVRLIERAADGLATTVDDLLDLAKAEAGRLEVRLTHLEVRELFAVLNGMLRPLVASDAVQFVVDEPEGVPAMHTDEAKVTEILRNLVSNALKYTTEGEVRVSASYDPAVGAVIFCVRDTGIGIDERDKERIFEEFVQLPGPLQVRSRGTGLGLSVARRLAHVLGGSLELESAPGRGSTFRVVLPRVYPRVVEGAVVAEEPTTAPVGPAGALAAAPAQVGPVLVVDDDENYRLVLRRMLRGLAERVEEAAGGEEALALARRMRPAAIVLDLAMPGMGGQELLRRLGAEPASHHLPVLVLTSLELTDRDRAELGPQVRAVMSKREATRDALARALPVVSNPGIGESADG
jgi:signal transduction histidine kinase/CheY-like chemotaxis protein